MDLIERYRHPGVGPKKMAQDAGSRIRDWFVEDRGDRWPLKALYFLAMKREEPGQYGSPGDFHTEKAQHFMESLGFEVVRLDGETVAWSSHDATVSIHREKEDEDITVLLRFGESGYTVVEAVDEASEGVVLTDDEVATVVARATDGLDETGR